MRQAVLLAAVFGVFGVLGGCLDLNKREYYQIQMAPSGEGLSRKVAYRSLQPPDGEDPARFWPELGLRARVTEGEFDQERVTGPGRWRAYERFATAMGYTAGYVERFGGPDDPAERLSQIRTAADRTGDLLVGWFTAELGGVEGFEELRAFLDGQFRNDLSYLAAYVWMQSQTGQERDSYAEESVYVAQYLAERDYFPPEKLPAVYVAFLEGAARGDWSRVFRIIRIQITRHMDVSPDSESLAFLSDLPHARQSLADYYRTTEPYQQHLAEWRKEHPLAGKDNEPDPLSVAAGETVEGLIDLPKLFGPHQYVRVSLECPVPPFETNGGWVGETSTVIWPSELAGEGPVSVYPQPRLVYAFWSAPDPQFQQAHFERVVLAGRELAAYCLWRNGLRPADAEAWDVFLTQLTPSDDLAAKLAAFRFPGEAGPPEASLADSVRELLVGSPTTRPVGK